MPWLRRRRRVADVLANAFRRDMRMRSVRYSACADRASILSAEAFALRPTSAVSDEEGMQVKGSQKPKKLGKKPAQKTLKERRTEKRAAAKHASRGLDV